MLAPMLSPMPTQHRGGSSAAVLQPRAAATQSSSTSAASGSVPATPSASSSAGITANDFLSLLVTEIQNQDPTNQTDPMSYITQLVGVNSLEQLVQINQDLTPSGTPGSTSSGTTSGASGSGTTPTAAIAKSTMPLATGATSALLPIGSHGSMTGSAVQAVAQAMGRSVPMASQASPTQLPPSHVAVQPEVLRAIEMSIPGATMSGLSTPANIPALPSGIPGGSLR